MTSIRRLVHPVVAMTLTLLVSGLLTQASAQTPAAIHDIQGNGLASPFADRSDPAVVTEGIVTAVGPSGFFLQVPDNETDTDPDTSEGIYVYTGTAPSVTAGDRVRVTGTVSEYFDLTEISGSPVVEVLSTGNPLPSPVLFDDDTPSGEQPRSPVEMERFEGMRIAISNGWICSGTDPYGEVNISATTSRPMREPGIAYPGETGLPVWDGNPELFSMKPEALGLTVGELTGGSRISWAVGPLTYAYGEYVLWPSELNVDAEPYPREPRDRRDTEAVIATQNLHNLTASDTNRFAKLSLAVRTLFRKPDILAVQEVEHLATLQNLADRIASDDPTLSYTAYLEPGNNGSTQNIGFLVRDSVAVEAVTQIQADDTFDFNGNTYTLHDRPPLLLEGTVAAGTDTLDIAVLAVHIRSMIDVDTKPWVREKRNQQARHIATFIQNYQATHPQRALFVMGDFNAFPFTDGYVDVTGTITGNPDPLGAMVPAEDLVEPDLTNLVDRIPESSRYSFVTEGTAQVLDQILGTAPAVDLVRDVTFVHAGADAPDGHEDDPADTAGLSDHDGLLAFLAPPKDPIVDSVTIDPDGTVHVNAHDPDGGGIPWIHWRLTATDTTAGQSSRPDFRPPYRTGGDVTLSVAAEDDDGALSPWSTATATVSVDTHSVRPLPTDPVMAPYQVTTWIVNPESSPVTISIGPGKSGKTASAAIPAGGKLAVSSLAGLPDATGGWVLDSPLRLPILVELAGDTAHMSAPLAPASASSLLIPHIAESTGYWNTTVFLSNNGGGQALVTVGAHTQTVMDEASRIDVESLLPDPPVEATAWGTVSADPAALSGFELFVKEGGDGAGAGLPSAGSNFLYIPHIPTNTSIFWTGFALVNTGSQDTVATFTFYTDTGLPLGSLPLSIPAGSKIKGLMADLFPSVAGQAGWGTIRSDQPLAGIEIYGTYHAGICGFALPDHAGTDLILPVMLTGDGMWTGVAVTNPSGSDTGITIRLVGSDGTVKMEKQETLAAENRFKFVAGTYFEGVTLDREDIIRILSGEPLIAMEASGDLDRTFMMAGTAVR